MLGIPTIESIIPHKSLKISIEERSDAEGYVIIATSLADNGAEISIEDFNVPHKASLLHLTGILAALKIKIAAVNAGIPV